MELAPAGREAIGDSASTAGADSATDGEPAALYLNDVDVAPGTHGQPCISGKKSAGVTTTPNSGAAFKMRRIWS